MLNQKLDVSAQIRQFIVNEFVYSDEGSEALRDNTALIDENIIDSFGIHTLIMFLESEYGIHVRDEEVIPDNLGSINAITNYVLRKMLRKTDLML